MSRDKYLEAKTLKDNNKITNIIQNAKIIPIGQEGAPGYAQIARLQTPQQVDVVYGALGLNLNVVSIILIINPIN